MATFSVSWSVPPSTTPITVTLDDADRVHGREQQVRAVRVERAGLDARDTVRPQQLVRVLDQADIVDGEVTGADDRRQTSGSARASLPSSTRSLAVAVLPDAEAGRVDDRDARQRMGGDPLPRLGDEGLLRPERPLRERRRVVVGRLDEREVEQLSLACRPRPTFTSTTLPSTFRYASIQRDVGGRHRHRRAGLVEPERHRLEHRHGGDQLGDARHRQSAWSTRSRPAHPGSPPRRSRWHRIRARPARRPLRAARSRPRRRVRPR